MKEFFENFTKLLLKRYFIIALIGGCIGLLMLTYLSYNEEYLPMNLKGQLSFALLGMLLLLGFDAISRLLDHIFPWQGYTGTRIFAGIIIFSSIITGIAYLSINSAIEPIPDELIDSQEALPSPNNELVTKIAILSVIFSLIYTIIYFARYSYKQFAYTQVETIRQERKQIDLQLKALKSQLGPHFLFNSLNAISSLIYKEENKAEEFVRKLALNYHYLIRSHEQTLVLLAEEIEFAFAYHHLLKTRMGDHVKLSHNLSEDLLNTKIPPVTLQMLIENAVKHNQIGEDNILMINIRSEKDSLIVTNNITKVNEKATSHQIGLKNINSRYELLVGKGIDIVSNDSFEVKLPLIK